MLSSHLSLLLPSGAGGSTKVDLRDWGVVSNSCESESRATQVVSIRSNRWFEFRAGFSQKFSRLLLSLRQLVIGRPVSLGWRNSRKEGKIEHLNKLRRAKLRSDFVTEVKIWGAADAEMGHPWFCCPPIPKSFVLQNGNNISSIYVCFATPSKMSSKCKLLAFSWKSSNPNAYLLWSVALQKPHFEIFEIAIRLFDTLSNLSVATKCTHTPLHITETKTETMGGGLEQSFGWNWSPINVYKCLQGREQAMLFFKDIRIFQP